MANAHAVAQLRHLYAQMLRGEVRDQAQAARYLLGPAIETLEMEGISPAHPVPAESGETLHLEAGERGAIEHLVRVATKERRHRSQGLCPDRLNGPDLRDWECAACQAIDTVREALRRIAPATPPPSLSSSPAACPLPHLHLAVGEVCPGCGGLVLHNPSSSGGALAPSAGKAHQCSEFCGQGGHGEPDGQPAPSEETPTAEEPAAVPYTGSRARSIVGKCACGGDLVRFAGARTPQAQCLKCKAWSWPGETPVAALIVSPWLAQATAAARAEIAAWPEAMRGPKSKTPASGIDEARCQHEHRILRSHAGVCFESCLDCDAEWVNDGKGWRGGRAPGAKGK